MICFCVFSFIKNEISNVLPIIKKWETWTHVKFYYVLEYFDAESQKCVPEDMISKENISRIEQ